MSFTCGFALAAITVAAVSDALTGYIYDGVIVVGLSVTGSVALLEHRVVQTVAGLVVAVGVMLAIRCVSGARRLGLGDVKLAALVGAGLGPTEGLMAIGAAFVVGAASAMGFLAAGRVRLGSPVRFGPYLLAGSLCDLAYHRLSAGVFP